MTNVLILGLGRAVSKVLYSATVQGVGRKVLSLLKRRRRRRNFDLSLKKTEECLTCSIADGQAAGLILFTH